MKNPETGRFSDGKESDKKISRREAMNNITKYSIGALGFFMGLNYFNKRKLEDNKIIDNNKNKTQKIEEEKKQTIEKKELNEVKKKTLKKIELEAAKILEVNNYKDLQKICERVSGYDKYTKIYSNKFNILSEHLSGLIFIESKGDTKAYNKYTGATGICQFTYNTAKEFGLTDRNNPELSIEAAAQFINYYRKYLGTEDLAVASFHMGYGNMYDLIKDFIKPDKFKKFPAEIVEKNKLNYPKIYFGINNKTKPKSYNILHKQLKDESADYYFKINAAAYIMHLYKTDPNKLQQLSKKIYKEM